ncbi:MAG: ABC transporter ATP-binding protein [Acidobacteriota bacterium]
MLEIRDLEIAFPAPAGEVAVVRGAALEIGRGEIVGLVGESGSGKSLTALAVLGLVPAPGRIRAGSIRFEGRELVGLSERELRPLRGGRIGLVFQEPSAALNPVLTVGTQIVEAIRAHRDLPRRAARERARELLALLAVPDPDRRLDEYPHQLSGGQRQRALVAIALAAGPDLLIADEPTTALDVTVQAQVLELLVRLRRELGLAILLITHDLAVVAETCDRAVVMYAGRPVEAAPVEALFAAPAHPYTRALLASLPRLGEPVPRGALPSVPGQVPTPTQLPAGCPFHPRCAERLASCSIEDPPWLDLGGGRGARCVLAGTGRAAS